MSAPAKGPPEPEETKNGPPSSNLPPSGTAEAEAPNVKRELIRRQTVLAVPKLVDRTTSFRSRSNSNSMAPKGEKILNNDRALELIFEELMVWQVALIFFLCCLMMIYLYNFSFSHREK
jgi:hypothetical protein